VTFVCKKKKCKKDLKYVGDSPLVIYYDSFYGAIHQGVAAGRGKGEGAF